MNSRSFSSVCFSAAMLAAACLVLGGCTAVKQTPPAAKKTAEPYRVEKEGKIPPLTASDVRREADHEETYEDLPVAEEPVTVETVEPVSEVPASAVDPAGSPVRSEPASEPAKTMDGYRIQVFASANEAAARSAKEAVEVRLGAAAYVEYVDGMYKVRVGDCPTREEAEVLLKKCRDAGYGDAWVSAGRILVPGR